MGEIIMDIQSYLMAKNYVNSVLSGVNIIVGKSAYEIALDCGFEGTPEEWLETLKGDKPTKGVDYFTAADKDELVSLVLSSLPSAEEVTI